MGSGYRYALVEHGTVIDWACIHIDASGNESVLGALNGII